MKQLLWAVANRLIYIIAILLPGIFGGWLTSLWAIPLAAAERGYTGAYGGEYLLIGFVFVMSVWAANAHLQAREEIRRAKCRKNDADDVIECSKAPSVLAQGLVESATKKYLAKPYR